MSVNAQVIPLNSDPNQTFQVSLGIDGGTVTIVITLRFNEIAQYWVATIRNLQGNLILDSVPLLTGDFPAGNILGQFSYLFIGSAFIVNVSGVNKPYPDDTDLGTDFILAWGNTPITT
jgi:hypothetical protein